ncbi:MAG: DUF4093 domain-containing protein [Oscillospiraceae bacterium]
MEKLFVSKAVIVEGKYDKIKLSSIIDGLIIQTNGFRIYKDKEKIALVKAVALKQGVIIVTDSDVAGFKLRGFIRSIAKEAEVTNIYIPQVIGKEKRKVAPSKENFLGVEGIDANTLRELFIKADVIRVDDSSIKKITKMDFFEDGLTGCQNSAQKRQCLLKHLGLPCYVTTNSLVDIINSLMTYEQYRAIMPQLQCE